MVADKLGSPGVDNYELVFKFEAIGGGLTLQYLAEARPKVQRDRETATEISAIGELLDNRGVAVEAGLEVFRAVYSELRKHRIRYVINDEGEAWYPADGDLVVPVERSKYFSPDHVRNAEANLALVVRYWVEDQTRNKILKDIESLDLPSKLAEVELRLLEMKDSEASWSGYYKSVLEQIKARIEDELAIEKARVQNLQATMLTNRQEVKAAAIEGEEAIGKPQLTIDQFIMLMFAIGGSRLKGLDRKMIAEGLSALTGNASSGYKNHFSQVLEGEEGIKKFNTRPELYNRDVTKVCDILTKMGLTDEVTKLKANSGI